MSHHLNNTAAVVLAGGGVAGYLKAKSVPSLVMGVGSAVTLGATSWMIQNGHPDRGHQVATATGVFLMGALPRAIKTRRFMPAGAVVTVGAAVALFNGKKAIEWEYGV